MLSKRISIVPVLVTAGLAAASCGGGSASSSSSTTGTAGQRPPRAQLTATQISCLKQQGVTMPGRGAGGPPGAGGGAPGGGQLSTQQRQQRRQKMLAAFQKCGIQPPQFGGGAGQPPSGGTSQ